MSSTSWRDDRETETGAAESAGRRGVGLGERLEHAVLVGGRDADAGVADLEAHDRDVDRRSETGIARTHDLAGAVNFTALETRFTSTWRRRVGSPRTSRGQIGIRVGEQLEVLGVRGVAEERGDVFEEHARVEVDDLELELAGLDLGEVQDVVDDREESFGRGVHARGVLALLAVERGVEEQLAQADHGVHRRADLVAHRREELRLQARCLHRPRRVRRRAPRRRGPVR